MSWRGILLEIDWRFHWNSSSWSSTANHGLLGAHSRVKERLLVRRHLAWFLLNGAKSERRNWSYWTLVIPALGLSPRLSINEGWGTTSSRWLGLLNERRGIWSSPLLLSRNQAVTNLEILIHGSFLACHYLWRGFAKVEAAFNLRIVCFLRRLPSTAQVWGMNLAFNRRFLQERPMRGLIVTLHLRVI